VGRETIKKLLENGKTEFEIIAAVRNISRAEKSLDYEEIKFRKFDFENLETVKNALIDIDKILLVRPPAIAKVKK